MTPPSPSWLCLNRKIVTRVTPPPLPLGMVRPGKDQEWWLLSMRHKPVKSRPHRYWRPCRAAGHSAIAERLHPALKIMAVWFLKCAVRRPATDRETERPGQTAAWWIFVSGEKSIDAANFQESSNILGLCAIGAPKPSVLTKMAQGRHQVLPKKIRVGPGFVFRPLGPSPSPLRAHTMH